MRKFVLLKLNKEQLEQVQVLISAPEQGKTGLERVDVENLRLIVDALKQIKEDALKK